MKNILSIDAHCDTVLKAYESGTSFQNNKGETHISLNTLGSLKPHIQFMALFCNHFQTHDHFNGLMELVDYFYKGISSAKDNVVFIRDAASLSHCIENKSLGIILAVEGAYLLVDNLYRIDFLHRLGVRCMSFTWNPGNGLCGGIGDNEDNGLSQQGAQAVKKMNDLGMIIDLSHISKRGFWDIIELSDKPVIASHSNCLSLCHHSRNLDDRQLEAIGRLNGVVGVNFVPDFLGSEKKNISGVADHIEHIIEKAGINSIGLGSDFDGTEKLPDGICGAECYSKIYEELSRRKYSRQDLEKIMGGNFYRILRNTL